MRAGTLAAVVSLAALGGVVLRAAHAEPSAAPVQEACRAQRRMLELSISFHD